MSIYPTLTVLGILLLSYYFYRTLFHPVCIQSALWFSQLGGLWLLQDQFDLVSTRTLWLIAGGVIGFGIGGSIMSVLLYTSDNKEKHNVILTAKDFTVPIVIAFPIILYIINAVVPFTSSISYFSIIKESTSDASVITFGYIGTLIVLLNVYIVTIYTCKIENRFALPVAITFSIILSAIIGAKGFLFFLATSLLFSGLYTKRLHAWKIATGLMIVICFFVIITILRTQDKASGKDFYIYVLQTYTFSAIPALDQEINSIYSHADHNTFRTVCLWLNKIGFHFEITPMVDEFVFVPQATNVFTYLYPYYLDFGFWGAILICFGLGICHGYFHIKAINGNVRHVIFASLLSYPLLMQFFIDQYSRWTTNWIYFMIIILISTRMESIKPSSVETAH